MACLRGWGNDASLFQKLMSRTVKVRASLFLALLGSDAEQSEVPGHTWHRAVVPLSHGVFLAPSFPAALCLLPKHVCGSLKLVGWGEHGVGWSGHPRKPFQCSARLHGLKIANHICYLTFIHILFAHRHRSIFLSQEKKKKVSIFSASYR